MTFMSKKKTTVEKDWRTKVKEACDVRVEEENNCGERLWKLMKLCRSCL